MCIPPTYCILCVEKENGKIRRDSYTDAETFAHAIIIVFCARNIFLFTQCRKRCLLDCCCCKRHAAATFATRAQPCSETQRRRRRNNISPPCHTCTYVYETLRVQPTKQIKRRRVNENRIVFADSAYNRFVDRNTGHNYYNILVPRRHDNNNVCSALSYTHLKCTSRPAESRCEFFHIFFPPSAKRIRTNLVAAV